MSYKDTDRAIAHLEKLREDIRDEIKKRIEQRDKYSIQLIIASSAIIALALSKPDYSGVLIVLPLLSIYFIALIMYSYKIHRTAARYLREKIEPELAFLCGISVGFEWETYYKKQNIPGIRHGFFILMTVVVTAISLLYLWIANKINRSILLSAAIIYFIFIILILIFGFRSHFTEKRKG